MKMNGNARLGERGLITARRLALAIFQVEQLQIPHLLKATARVHRPAG